MKIQHKRSAVAIGGVAKEPTAAQTEQGELCVNFSTEDPALFIKDADENIIRVGGDLSLYQKKEEVAASTVVCRPDEIDGLSPPAVRGEGTLWWNTEDGVLYVWYKDADSEQWVITVPQTIPEALTQAEADGRYLRIDAGAGDQTRIAGEATFSELTTHEGGAYLNGTFTSDIDGIDYLLYAGTDKAANESKLVITAGKQLRYYFTYNDTLGDYLRKFEVKSGTVFDVTKTTSPDAAGSSNGQTFAQQTILNITGGGINNNNANQRVGAIKAVINQKDDFRNTQTNGTQRMYAFVASTAAGKDQINGADDEKGFGGGYVFYQGGGGNLIQDVVAFDSNSSGRAGQDFTAFKSIISAEAGRERYGFLATGDAPNFLAGSTYIGGNTTRNTFELWKSTLTEEQLEQLEAGTLVAPANVSTPGDGIFARQWWYNQQSAEDQALIDAGELEYPEYLAAATFTDTFALGDNTKINLNSNGLGEFKGGVNVTGSTNIGDPGGSSLPQICGVNLAGGQKLMLVPKGANSTDNTVRVNLNPPQAAGDGGGVTINHDKNTAREDQANVLKIGGNWTGDYSRPGGSQIAYNAYALVQADITGATTSADKPITGFGVGTSTTAGKHWCAFRSTGLVAGETPGALFIGFQSQVQEDAATEAYNFYATGTAPNFFKGNITCDGLINGAFSLRMDTDDPAAYQTSYSTDEDGEQVEEQTYIGTTEDLLSIIKDLRARVVELESNTLQPLYSTLSDLPDASDHHGKTAHVHSEGALYFAHAGNWVKLQNA